MYGTAPARLGFSDNRRFLVTGKPESPDDDLMRVPSRSTNSAKTLEATGPKPLGTINPGERDYSSHAGQRASDPPSPSDGVKAS